MWAELGVLQRMDEQQWGKRRESRVTAKCYNHLVRSPKGAGTVVSGKVQFRLLPDTSRIQTREDQADTGTTGHTSVLIRV